jgi:hypothetical protein
MWPNQTKPGACRSFSKLQNRPLPNQARNRLPLLVGGTGQYVRAVLQDWDLPDQEPDNRLREALERWAAEIGPYGLHAAPGAARPARGGLYRCAQCAPHHPRAGGSAAHWAALF